MYSKYSYLACVISVLFGLVASNEPTKTVLTANIFYDTVDPNCTNFISNKFAQVYQPFEQYLNVNFVPFGKAELTNGNLICPASPQYNNETECYANKVHACAVHLLQKTADKIKFIICTINNSNSIDPKNVTLTYPTQKCVDLVNVVSELNKTSIDLCIANQSLGLLEKYSKATKDLGEVKEWPVITLNSEPYDIQKSKNLVHDFTDTLCQKFETDATLKTLNIAVCKSNSTTTTAKSETTKKPDNAAAINSITVWPIVIATIFSVFFGVKLG